MKGRVVVVEGVGVWDCKKDPETLSPLQADDDHTKNHGAKTLNLSSFQVKSMTSSGLSLSLSRFLFQPQEQNVGLAAARTGTLGRTAGTPVQLGQHEQQQQGGAGPPHQVRSFSSSWSFH